LLVANLDLDDVARGRYDFDAAGHYSRPDIFTLHVDREERSVILP
jgi:nitrilase